MNSQRPGLKAIVTDKTLALMLALGFSSGLPFLLIFSTQSARLREAGVPVTEIGLLSYVALCYSFKFVWSPAIDAFDLPILARLLGRRRAWMLAAQLAVALGLLALSASDPKHGLTGLVVASFLTAFAAATQDIVVDGWRIDAAPIEKQGMMSATYQLGFRLALLCAGAGAFYIADYANWHAAYATMAALMLIGIGANLLSPRRPDRVVTPGRPGLAVVEPVGDLARRYGLWLVVILLLVALYRLPDFLTGVMANPLYIDLGFSKSEIATASKLYGVWIGIAGAFGGGLAISRLGLMPSLLIGGIAASASHLALAWLALHGHRFDLLIVSVSLESFAGGFAGTALIAFMSSLTTPALAASQYALLSSLYALPGKVIGGLSGLMVAKVGYPIFFACSSTIGIPVAALCLLVWGHRWRTSKRPEKAGEEPPFASTKERQVGMP